MGYLICMKSIAHHSNWTRKRKIRRNLNKKKTNKKQDIHFLCLFNYRDCPSGNYLCDIYCIETEKKTNKKKTKLYGRNHSQKSFNDSRKRENKMHTFSENSSGVPAFLAKLWRLVEDEETNNLIYWSSVSKVRIHLKRNMYISKL